MNKDIFESVANIFTEYCADHFDSDFEDVPEGFNTAEGFLNYFEEWLEENIDNEENGNDFEHVLDNFDEVEAEEIEEGVFIPVIDDSESTAHYMDGQ